MNLFEKIHNYQLQELLSLEHESQLRFVMDRQDRHWLKEILAYGSLGPLPITNTEKQWLKAVLLREEALQFVTPALREKLLRLLATVTPLNLQDDILEKTRPSNRHLSGEYLALLSDLMHHQKGLRLDYCLNNGEQFRDQQGIPYCLEFSMTRREWYLLWCNITQQPEVLTTPLRHIYRAAAVDINNYTEWADFIRHELAKRRQQVVLEIDRTNNHDRDRIFYSLSCFAKEVTYSEAEDIYHIKLWYVQDEAEYVLHKIRFLGQRIIVKEPSELRLRMKDTASRALERYSNPNKS